MADLSHADREMATAELQRIEQVLSAMSAWIDGNTHDRERAAVLLEDAAQRVMAAGWLIERDPERVSELLHRRLPSNSHFRPL